MSGSTWAVSSRTARVSGSSWLSGTIDENGGWVGEITDPQPIRWATDGWRSSAQDDVECVKPRITRESERARHR